MNLQNLKKTVEVASQFGKWITFYGHMVYLKDGPVKGLHVMEDLFPNVSVYLPVLADVLKVCDNKEYTLDINGKFKCGAISTKLPIMRVTADPGPFLQPEVCDKAADFCVDVAQQVIAFMHDTIEFPYICMNGNEFHVFGKHTSYMLKWNSGPPITGAINTKMFASLKPLLSQAAAQDVWIGKMQIDGRYLYVTLHDWVLSFPIPENTVDYVELYKSHTFLPVCEIKGAIPPHILSATKADCVRWQIDKTVEITTLYNHDKFGLSEEEKYELTYTPPFSRTIYRANFVTKSFSLTDGNDITVAIKTKDDKIVGARFEVNDEVTAWTSIRTTD